MLQNLQCQQLQPLAQRQPALFAEAHQRFALDELHREEGLPVRRRAGVRAARRGLPLGALPRRGGRHQAGHRHRANG